MRVLLLSSLILMFAACSGGGDDGPDARAATDTGTNNPPPDGGQVGGQPDTGTMMTPPDAGTTPTPDAGINGMCTNLTVFADADDDAYGVSSQTQDACLLPGEELDGYARQAGDCRPNDPWANPSAEEICGDNVDDNCDQSDSLCPTTATAQIQVPTWDCINGPPPANVYAWAVYADGGTYFQPNGCFVFFEGLPNEFYVQRVNVTRANTDPSCEMISGCTCPSLEGWPAYDRRLYAWTLRGDANDCPPMHIEDHGGMTQQVSSDCRKYLYQLHYYDIPYSYVASSVDSLERRITLFPTVEIACAKEQYPQLPFTTLVTAPIQRNTSFVKQ
jgi:hypothetical protein